MTTEAERLSQLLVELESRLRDWGAPVVDALRPGAAPDAVRSALAAEGVQPLDELVAWWSWHDGAEGTSVPAPSPLYVVDWPGRPGPTPQFSSLAEFVEVVVRLFDAGLVTPDPDEPRLPSLRNVPLEGDVRRLLVW